MAHHMAEKLTALLGPELFCSGLELWTSTGKLEILLLGCRLSCWGADAPCGGVLLNLPLGNPCLSQGTHGASRDSICPSATSGCQGRASFVVLHTSSALQEQIRNKPTGARRKEPVLLPVFLRIQGNIVLEAGEEYSSIPVGQ